MSYGYLITKEGAGFYRKVHAKTFAKLKGVSDCCVFCGTTENLTIDHILPKSTNPKARGLLANYQLLCYDCNQKKQANKYYGN
jgi:5-methylcytosine-specific restriction endonuclease McrA